MLMKPCLIIILLFILPAAAVTSAQGRSITVSPDGHVTSISAAIASAGEGDTVRVLGGVYREHLVIDKSITLTGEGYPSVDGGGKGVVVHIKTPGVVIKGMHITGSGDSLNLEDAGILAENARGCVIEGNRLDDVLFGIYLKNSPDGMIKDNYVRGKDLTIAERGDGVKLWYSSGTKIIGNTLYNARDLVMWWSGDTVIKSNRVEKGRYGLHYMYSNNNVFTDNIFIDNYVGGFLMYSDNITFHNNVFARNQGPATGYGIGFKDLDHVVAEGNLFIDNRVGLYMDNSPHLVDAWNKIEDNVIAYNDIGVSMMPSIERNVFVGNTFLDNHEQIEVRGGGHLGANVWFKDGRGNYWSDYAGYDEDGDGVGEIPYKSEKLFESLIDRIPELRLFIYSPVTRALELAADAFPVIKPEPKLTDERPLMGSRVPARYLSAHKGVPFNLLAVSFAMALAPLVFYGYILKR
jgi:nitrous oxide reductase family maturation protein NosD